MKIVKHFRTITKHRHKVMRYCFKCGLIKQGLLHDLSKYSFVEFFNGAKYYSGNFSPNQNERKSRGYSLAWMHHKGRNKHHSEYWTDVNIITRQYEPVEMPDRYIAESICDRIAASEIYNKNNFEPIFVLNYFYKEAGRIMHPKTYEKFETLLKLYVENGQKYLFKYLKKNYRAKK